MFQPRTKQRIAVCGVSAVMLLWTSVSNAEYADREKPINLEADQVIVDDAKQISTFTGNVRLSQGTLLILGDKIVVEQDKEGYVRVIAHGRTASFRQKREAAEGYVEGYGERIEYNAKSEVMYLDVQARLKRDLDEVIGEHITYNAKTELFQVNASETEPDFVRQKRVRVVLQPKNKGSGASVSPGPDRSPAQTGGDVTQTEQK